MGAALVAVATVLASCSTSAPLGAQVAQWESVSGFGSTIGTLVGDGARVVTVVHRGQGTGALKASCGVLEAAASSADATLPAPVTQLTTTLSGAFHDELAAAGLCYGAAPTDRATLTHAIADVVRADAQLEQAVQLVSGLTGKVPSTTTTTTPGGGAGGDPLGF